MKKLPFHVFAIYFFPESAINLKFEPYEAPQGANKSVGHFFEIFIFFKMAAIFMPKYVKIAVFGTNKAAILKKMKISKKCPTDLFAPWRASYGSNLRFIALSGEK